MELENWKAGDYVTLTNQSTHKLQIGRIEDINESEGTFTYIPFYKPEETHCGRLSYHGKNEIFKGNQNREETLSNIIAKVEVLNPQDYSKVPQDKKFASDVYVCRQHYDMEDQFFFTPSEIEPDCFCNRILNPDDDLVLCECDRLFHYQCITSEQGTCPTCANNLSNLGDTLYKRRKLDDDKTIVLKPDTEFYDIFANALDDVVTDTTNKQQQQQNTSYSSKSLLEKRPISALQTRKNPNNQLNIRAGTMTHAKKGQRRELTNIGDDAYERVKHALDVFSKAHQNKNMGDIERSRYIIKENYYKSLLYGVEEVKEKERLAGSYLLLSEEARMIAVKDTRQNYKNAENLAFNIEAIVWHTMNRNKSRIDPNYGMKNRELQSYLMDDNNFELRLNILSGNKKPEFLCQASGKELCSKNMSQKLEKKEMKTLQLSKISDEIKIVAKSHKGEVVIETNESTAPQISEPKKEPEPVAEESKLETITNLVQKIERKGSEGLSRKNSGRSMLMEGDDDDDMEFKLKKSKFSKSNSGEDSSLSENNGNRAADTLLKISSLGNNRLIDQDVLKNVTNFFFDTTYSNIMERINNHLKPEIANKVSREINSKHKW